MSLREVLQTYLPDDHPPRAVLADVSTTCPSCGAAYETKRGLAVHRTLKDHYAAETTPFRVPTPINAETRRMMEEDAKPIRARDEAVHEVQRKAAREGRKATKEELEKANGGKRTVGDKIRQFFDPKAVDTRPGMDKNPDKDTHADKPQSGPGDKGDGSWDESKHPRDESGKWD